MLWHLPTRAPVQGIFVFGSGDGGWSYWEEIVCGHLAKRGWAVAGVDFARYAETDFSREILASDYAAIVNELGRRCPPAPDGGGRPVIFGGWSMGAEHAVAAAAARSPVPSGLLLVAPGARGRYGLHMADTLGLAPKGPGTFGLADFASALGGMRIAQLHATLDPLDSTDWFRGLGLELRLWKYPRAFHDFDGASDEFLALVDKSVAWLLKPSTTGEKHE